MSKNLNLIQIFKDCPICPLGTKLYSLVHGDVYLHSIDENSLCPIILEWGTVLVSYSNSGKYLPGCKGECVLFPSKENRDWSKFKVNKSKFDPKTLKPFDRVLVRNHNNLMWMCNFFSHNDYDDKVICSRGVQCNQCVPYNEETKHLVGTTEEAPEYYRYWEE